MKAEEIKTSPPVSGEWKLTSPDGRTWVAESPILCVRKEQEERIPPTVALARIMKFATESEFAEKHLQLAEFYSAENKEELIDKMERHIEKLQEKISDWKKSTGYCAELSRRVRER